MGGRNECRILVLNPQGEKPVVKQKLRWMDNIKMDCGDRMRCNGLDLYGSGQGPVECPCEQHNGVYRVG
jgi:hypothetical protein